MVNYIIVIILSLILILILNIILKIEIKRLKAIGMKDELNEIAKKYPSNVVICKELLKKLNNKKVKVEENLNSKSCIYIAISDKILIADTKNSYTRIQTIAHECLHSIQDRRILIFNFIYSNIYLMYFIVMAILIVCLHIPNKMIYITIFLILGLIYYVIRSYLENDAMIKARYLAKEYLEDKKISSKEEIAQLIKGYDELNDLGIKCVNFGLVSGILIKTIILSLISIIF